MGVLLMSNPWMLIQTLTATLHMYGRAPPQAKHREMLVLLMSNPWMRCVESEHLGADFASLVACGELTQFEENQEVFVAGTSVDKLIVIAAGTARLSSPQPRLPTIPAEGKAESKMEDLQRSRADTNEDLQRSRRCGTQLMFVQSCLGERGLKDALTKAGAGASPTSGTAGNSSACWVAPYTQVHQLILRTPVYI